jgi:hypothetical protein
MIVRSASVWAGLVFALDLSVAAQAPDHSGTWKLNREASQITVGTGLTGLGAGGVPPTLYIAQAANGTAVVGSDINESGAKLYQARGKGLTLERDGTTEQFTVSADGKTLTVTVTSKTGSSTLVYTRTTQVEPCEKWPTACRW